MTSQPVARYHQHPTAYPDQSYLQRPEEEPVSRTYQYRKVMKPMLERKRRARINRCLDELKELMVAALQAEGENVAKLEKADILELTVRHLHNLRRQGRLVVNSEVSYTEKFKAGFTHCASEVSQFIANSTMASQKNTTPESQAGTRLLQHLSSCIRRLESAPYPPRPRPISPAQMVPVQQNPVLRPPNQNHHIPKESFPHSVNKNNGKVENGRGYAPPSPPASPASSSSSSEGHAPSMWRPW